MDVSDYWLSMEDFNWLERRFGPFEADYFASDRSWRMKPFYARFGCGESEGVDAFAVSWRKGNGYFHPPVGMITRVIRKAERTGARGILVAPDWPGSAIFMLIREKVSEGRMRIVQKWRPFLHCPWEIVSNTFRGRLKFDMIVVSFNFGQRKK